MLEDFKKITQNILCIFLLLVLIVGIYSKWGDRIDETLALKKLSRYLKVAIELLLLVYIVTFKLWRHVNVRYVFAFFAISFIGQLFLAQGNLNLWYEQAWSHAFTCASFIFLPLFIVVSTNLDVKKIVDTNIRTLKAVALINIPIVALAIIFDLQIFRSYYERFGYDGILPSSAAASYFYVLVITLFYVECLLKKEHPIWLFVHSFMALMIGTKTIWLFLILLMFIHLFFVQKGKLARYLKFATAGLIVVFCFFLGTLKEAVINFFPHGPDLYEERGFLSVLVSKRDAFLAMALNYVDENWTWVNYFFGGTNVIDIRVEMELINMLLYMGLLGTIAYALFLRRNFFVKGQAIIKTLLFFAIITLAMLTGGVFYSVFVSTLFYIVFKRIDFLHETNHTRP